MGPRLGTLTTGIRTIPASASPPTLFPSGPLARWKGKDACVNVGFILCKTFFCVYMGVRSGHSGQRKAERAEKGWRKAGLQIHWDSAKDSHPGTFSPLKSQTQACSLWSDTPYGVSTLHCHDLSLVCRRWTGVEVQLAGHSSVGILAEVPLQPADPWSYPVAMLYVWDASPD